jgi:hypothetical protein
MAPPARPSSPSRAATRLWQRSSAPCCSPASSPGSRMLPSTVDWRCRCSSPVKDRCLRPATSSRSTRRRRLLCPARCVRPRRRRDRPQPGRRDHRRLRLLLRPLDPAGTAAGRHRRVLPGAGSRIAARITRRRTQPGCGWARARHLVGGPRPHRHRPDSPPRPQRVAEDVPSLEHPYGCSSDGTCEEGALGRRDVG